MPDHLIRNIDPDLWRHIKARAALENVSLRRLIERLLLTWLDSPPRLVKMGGQKWQEGE